MKLGLDQLSSVDVDTIHLGKSRVAAAYSRSDEGERTVTTVQPIARIDFILQIVSKVNRKACPSRRDLLLHFGSSRAVGGAALERSTAFIMCLLAPLTTRSRHLEAHISVTE